MTPRVSVDIIPTRDRRALLERALLALAVQTIPATDIEVCVAVNGSTDGTFELLAALEPPYDLPVVRSVARPAARARATPLPRRRAARSSSSSTTTCARHRSSSSATSPTTPPARASSWGECPSGWTEHSTGAARSVADAFAAHMARLAEPGHVFTTRDFFSGNASLRAEDLRAAGGFDDAFGAYGNEDVELALRLRAAGVALAFDREALACRGSTRTSSASRPTRSRRARTTVQLARLHPEVSATLRLADPGDASRPWLTARAVLLALTRRRASVSARVFALAAGMERLGLWHRRLGYRALLDYAFWAGAQEALGRGGADPRLTRLADELRRRPVDVLLHGVGRLS